jgi:sugar lactone lactonase YvrE
MAAVLFPKPYLKAMTQSEARTITLPDASGVVVVSDDGNATLPDGSITASKLANNPGNGSSGQVIVSNGDGSFDWGSTGGAVLTQGSDSTILDYSIGEEGSAAGQFIVPFDIALDSNNNIYVVDTYNHRIQVFTASGDFSYTIGKRGNGQKEFFAPSGIAIDSNNNIYIGDSFNHQVQVLNASGDFSYSLGSGSLSSDPGKFNQPSGVVVDTNGNFYVADVLNHRIQVFTADGNYSFSLGTQGSDPGQFHSPVKVALDNSGYIYVADSLNHRIQVFTAQCEFSYSIGTGSEGSDPGKFNTPQGVDVDSNGRIYVADTENFRIQVFTASGAYDYSINLQENKPYSVKVYNNKIYVTCGHSVVVYNCPSQITHTIASGNVGIGITPTEKLEIDGNVKITNGLILANGSSSVSQTILKSMTQSEARTITLPDASGIAVVTEDGNITVSDGSITASKLANNPGNGITGQVLFSNGDGSFVWEDVEWPFTTTQSGVHTVETGNVGIGTTSPTETLEVDGNVKITNNLILANGSSSVSQNILKAMTQSEARTITLPDASGIVVVTDDGNITIPDGSITTSKLANNPGNGITGQTLVSNGDGTFGWAGFVTTQGATTTHTVEDGNVGIGTTSPTETFEINGTVHINNALKFQPISYTPAEATAGTLFYDNDTHKLKVYDGTEWKNCF